MQVKMESSTAAESPERAVCRCPEDTDTRPGGLGEPTHPGSSLKAHQPGRAESSTGPHHTGMLSGTPTPPRMAPGSPQMLLHEATAIPLEG
jgi:hypothetical protein